MTLYNAIRDVDNCRGCLDSRMKYLEQTAEQFKDEIPSLRERATAIAGELRRVQEEAKQGKRIQNHRLSNYFSQDQLTELDSLVGVLGSDVANKSGYPNDSPIRAAKEGTLWRYKNDVFVNHKILRKIRNGAIATSVVSSPFAGMAYLAETPNHVAGFYGVGAALGLLVASVSLGFIVDHVKNPFEMVADHLEQRSQYVLEKLPEVRR